MDVLEITYKIKTAAEQEIYNHLSGCNHLFIPPLDSRVNLHEYSKKIHEKSISFEAWSAIQLIGLVACYFNNPETKTGYITSVSVSDNYAGKGIANQLMNNCIKYAKSIHFKEINLEVNQNNKAAIRLYQKFGFQNLAVQEDNLIMNLVL